MSSDYRSIFRGGAAHPLSGATVLQIAPDLEDNALARATIEIAAALTRIGAQPLVAASGGALVSELQARGGLFAPFPADAANPLSMAINVRRLKRMIRAERVDLVHARVRAAAWPAYGATRLTRTPFVTSYLSAYARGGPLALRYSSVMARGDAIILPSNEAARELARLHPAAAGKAHVVPGGVDARVFSPRAVAPHRVQAVRRLWDAPADARIALAPAPGLTVAKRALEAFRRLADAPDAGLAGTRLVIAVDDATQVKAFEAAITAAGLGQVARAAPLGDDRPAALLAASCVALAAPEADLLGAFALEAQAMGAAVVAVAAGAAGERLLAPPDVEPERRTGWRVEGEDPEAFAAALREALALGASARDRLSLRARAHVEAEYSMERLWSLTLDAYASALALHVAARSPAR
ncbi:glycosyltransferase [Methylocella sp.]|uniref:glycosyltransferase n=1 Tax=Methylocella sp. TaxID=1978226 RepID=UPI0035ADA0C8